ncbi:unnamed protein product [Scytosiphon promiscuus]
MAAARGCAVTVVLALASSTALGRAPAPSLDLIQQTLLTTANLDFDGEDAFEQATAWSSSRVRGGSFPSPYLACSPYGGGQQASATLRSLVNPSMIRPVSSTRMHGACFMVTASHAEAEAVSQGFAWSSFGAFPAALKIAPGLLEHNDCSDTAEAGDCSTERLSTTHGISMRLDSASGLAVELSPGTLAAHDAAEAEAYIGGVFADLMSTTDLYSNNFWSDPEMARGRHLENPGGALRGREWSRAAAVVHWLGASGKTNPSDICSWDSVVFHYAAADVLLVSGLDHLLYSGRGVGGESGEEAAELHVACFMGLVSFLASRHEVLRVASWNMKRTLNAAARANIQSATVTDTPLTSAGLDGSGEVIQVVDSGLNETSCYFAHGDGSEVEHGHYFEEIGSTNPYFSSDSESFSKFKPVFEGGDFSYTSGRRKVIQYIELVKADEGEENASLSSGGVLYPYIPSDDFNVDDDLGHGTHTAATIAGSTSTDPAETVACNGGKVTGCGGGCISTNATIIDDSDGDDTSIDRLCPMFGCVGGYTDEQCLTDDVGQTLSDNGGMAQGAKIAVFDIFFKDYSYGDLAGNGLWEACLAAGCKIHSNSYGVDKRCELSSVDLLYDDFMYNNPENLLVFAAGNEGWFTDRDGLCTTNSPGIAKNVLAVGSTSSGETRLTSTSLDGSTYDSDEELGDINTISAFSSYGPTQDGRIKPEVVAPGDEIYSADGNDDGSDSCRLTPRAGTSMATAVASGAAALVRQYFTDSSFYSDDVESRGFCGLGFVCDGFSPSSATVKAMLINSANLMNEGGEPTAYRGFGRIHLEAGMPLGGSGDMALYVQDSASIGTGQYKTIFFNVDADAGLELRVTLSWIDPAASSLSAVQLVNDLDLRVYAPNNQKFCMFADNCWDTVNVNERIVISPQDVVDNSNGGSWAVRVRARDLMTDSQTYSLVVTGAISPGTGADSDYVSAAATDDSGDDSADDATGAAATIAARGPFLLMTAVALLAATAAAAFGG